MKRLLPFKMMVAIVVVTCLAKTVCAQTSFTYPGPFNLMKGSFFYPVQPNIYPPVVPAGSVITVSTNLGVPRLMAMDVQGNLYITDQLYGSIKKMAPGSGELTDFIGVNTPTGVATDAAGNIYVTSGSSSLLKFAPGGGPAQTLTDFLTWPGSVTVDAAGNIYVAEPDNGRVRKVSPDGLTITTLATGFYSPTALAVDAAGDILVVDAGFGSLKKIAAAGGAVTTVANGFFYPEAVAVDAAGNIYVTDAGDGSIKKIAAADGSITAIGYGFASPVGIAVDAAGNVFVADMGVLKEIVAVGGTPVDKFTVEPALPEGIFFDSSLGGIAGTPVATSALTTYTVTGHRSSGDITAQFQLKVNSTSLTQLTVCESALPYTWNGQTFDFPGSYTLPLTNSVVVIQLPRWS